MTREDYVLIANTLNDARGAVHGFVMPRSAEFYNMGANDAAIRLADAFESNDRHFDREQFINIAGVTA